MTASEDARTGKVTLPENGSQKRPRRYRETAEVAGGMQRQVRALAARIAAEDPPDLALLLLVEAELKAGWRTAIEGLRRSGFTDGEIAEALGVTRQAVEQRWPRRQVDDFGDRL